MLLFRTVIVITAILMGCCSSALDTKFNNAIGKLLICASTTLYGMWVGNKNQFYYVKWRKRGVRAVVGQGKCFDRSAFG